MGPDANIIGAPAACINHEVTLSNGNILKPSLPLVRVAGMFLQHRRYLLDALGAFPGKNMVSNGGREHMAGDVPSRSGKG